MNTIIDAARAATFEMEGGPGRAMSMRSWLILAQFRDRDIISLKDLRVAVGITPQGATQAVDQLVKHRWLSRIRSVYDRRTYDLRILSAGRKAMDEVLVDLDTVNGKAATDG